MLLPLFIISFSAYPVSDDFGHGLRSTEVYMRTNSLWETVRAAWDYMLYEYNVWQGTFTAMFFSALQPMVFSPKLYFLTPVFILGGLCLSMAYFSKALVIRTLKADRPACLVFFTALLTMVLQFLPSTREVIYWHCGTPYTISVILLFLMVGLVLKLHQEASRVRAVVRSVLLFLCGVLLAGCPYPLALSVALWFFFVTLWAFRKRSPARWACLFALAGMTAALLLVLLAPGNFVRQDRIGEPMAPLNVIMQSLAECVEITGRWFSPQLVATALILFLFLAPALQRTEFSFRHPMLFFLASFVALSAAFAPPLYAMGLGGHMVERVLSSLYMFYVFLLFINLIYWMGFFIRRFGTHGTGVSILKPRPVTWGALVLCGMLMIWGFFSIGITAIPSVSAARSLVSGEASQYRQELAQREADIVSSESKAHLISSIRPLTAQPGVLFRDNLLIRMEGPLSTQMYRFFRMHQLGEQYGVGAIPEYLWEDLEAWPDR